MRCVYCLEGIADGAIVCGHCGRDIDLVRPFEARISKIEQQLATLSAMVMAITSEPSADTDELATRPARRIPHQLTIPFVLSVACSSVSYYMFRRSPNGQLWLILSICMPLPFGFWSGIWWGGKHARAYLASGAIAGLVNMIAATMLAGAVTRFADLADWSALYVVAIYVAGGALLFTAGGLFGDQIERYYLGTPSTGSAARSIAKNLLRLEGRPATSDRISRLQHAISAIAPLLTFIGSLITAYLTYRATILKK